MIPYENLKRLNAPFEADFRARFDEVIEKGHYILGHQLEVFEKEFAGYHNAKNCIGVSNGLDAIVLALRALNLPAESEVIVPSNTYIATVLAVIAAGLKPVMVDPDINTYNIDPDKIEQAITRDTRVLLVVHLYGKCCDMDPIMHIKQKHNLYLVEDCAQAHGATYKGKLAGTFGEFGAFSFYPTKNLGALGDAGGIICNEAMYNSALLKLRNYGSDKKYYHDTIGYNNRLDEMQAAFLSVKLKYLGQMNAHRQKLAGLYLNNLSPQYILPAKHPDHFDVYHIFNIRHPERDRLQQYLADKGIGTVIHYPVPPHRQKALKSIFVGKDFPVADEIHDTTLSLPCSFCHTEEEILEVIDALNHFA
ncbi:aminotransferase [Mucilaginibacter sp. PPCGB 2223]|uniref:DegT/DnrJ/EryC1/StrS family aminotransferase n=1 Tax=Mucilaginibacter sp. PPCGB 2223 TaxID=1886027 RepID=UPI000824B352|nr:DegT/DnrJ/EryC1/StrS family aminotransferase [Mucilaginibacter sp. PPCGB 2223]OCX50251.1 aminotransferase [Mucilaginibacter sp. PPCGB 2223]